ncbi:MAG: glucose-1-phosphate thymidylyltransferase [Candidatus Schekmanbacteria bacterium]|nr:glucose-1-phosphate thymidylyltransferase [Candidatus Schekmanbacteria bacterium]
MKALVLSGGKGTRLRPLTHTSAKQLVPIANKSILFYCLESISEAGIKDVGIIVGDTHQEIKDAVKDGSVWGLQITYIKQDAPLGIAHAVKIAQDFIQDDDFVVFLGDNLIRGGIKGFVNEFSARKSNCQILLAQVAHPQEYGVAYLQEGRVLKLEEKPKNPKTDLALVGVYMFDSHIFEAVGAIKPSRRNELEITDAIQYLLDAGYQVNSHIIDGWWKDTGKLEDLLEANRLMLDSFTGSIQGEVDSDSQIEGRVVIQKGAKIINSRIRGPVIIGENTQIINSYIGPFTSINYNVKIENSEIEHSVILEESAIMDIPAKIADTLIGKNVQITRSNHKPRAYRFMLGDNSQVWL